MKIVRVEMKEYKIVGVTQPLPLMWGGMKLVLDCGKETIHVDIKNCKVILDEKKIKKTRA